MKTLISASILVLSLIGCGDFDYPPGGGEPTDSSGDSGILDADMSGGDTAAPAADARVGSTGMDGDELLARDGTGLEASRAGMPECYDDALAACDPTACMGVRSCCVGSGTCCGASGADAAPAIIVPGGCLDFDDALPCIGAGVTDFGNPTPYIFANAIVPNGDGVGDSGLFSNASVDLTVHRVTLSARFREPTECAGGCFDTLGMGMTAQAAVGGAVRVIASLLYSASRDRMALMVGETQVTYWDDVADGSEWTLDLQPSGTLRVLEEGIPMIEEIPFRTRSTARALVYGQSVNPSSTTEPTRLEGLSIDVSLCDVPDSWTGRTTLRVDLEEGGQLSADHGATAPSLISTGTSTLLAFEQGGSIRIAEDLGSGFVARTTPIASEATESWGDAGAFDPEIVANTAEGGYALFYTARGSAGDGAASIARVDLDEMLVPSEDGPTQVVTGAHVEGDWASEPTIMVHSPTVWIMVVNTEERGTRYLRVLRSDDGGKTWDRHRSYELEVLTARAGGRSGGAFDSDEIGHPALTIHNGAWHLHYVGRRGTRSSIGVLVSDNLVSWRNPNPQDGVFGPGAEDFETVAVSAPDVIVVPEGLWMIYVGRDGYQGRLGTTSRRATDSGTFF